MIVKPEDQLTTPRAREPRNSLASIFGLARARRRGVRTAHGTISTFPHGPGPAARHWDHCTTRSEPSASIVQHPGHDADLGAATMLDYISLY